MVTGGARKRCSGCIQEGSSGEDMDMMADAASVFASFGSTSFSRSLPACEIEVFSVSAKKGDVFPACIRLAQARSDEAWLDRLNIALAVGPACPASVLDMACQYMPRAAEPRLLRACAALRLAAMAKDDEERELFNDAARRDLLDVLATDIHDVTARAILFDLLATDYAVLDELAPETEDPLTSRS
jgi:hypothetical protein